MLHVYWPMTAFVTLFIVLGAIIVLLRFGPRLCKTRHHTLPDTIYWGHMTYSQPVGFESMA